MTSRMNQEIMKINDVAEYLKIAPSTVYRLIHQRQFPAFRFGGNYRISRAALDEWIERQARRSGWGV